MKNEKLAEIKLRVKISNDIKRQREQYKANNLFPIDYLEGMSDASLIVFDPDKHDEGNLLASHPPTQ